MTSLLTGLFSSIQHGVAGSPGSSDGCNASAAFTELEKKASSAERTDTGSLGARRASSELSGLHLPHGALHGQAADAAAMTAPEFSTSLSAGLDFTAVIKQACNSDGSINWWGKSPTKGTR